jgi:hypothetical protein
MSFSEPAWGWAGRELEAAREEDRINTSFNSPQIYRFQKTPSDQYEGRYYNSGNKVYMDKPLDGWPERKDQPFPGPPNLIRPELLRTGTTPNYRTVHLQRLANPLLPWNPPPGQFFARPTSPGAPGADLHRPNLPINPYRTVDTASVNLTAFNGVSEGEAHYPFGNEAQDVLRQNRPWLLGTELSKYLTRFSPAKYQDVGQILAFKSVERGTWSRLSEIKTLPSTVTLPPNYKPAAQRVLWAQEPPMVSLKSARSAGDIFDMIPGRQMSMRVA